jgi:hypothetical protein
MSYFGNQEDAIKDANRATKIIDGEDATSPVRDGGAATVEATGGSSFSHGTTEFQNVRDHGKPTGQQGHKPVRRMYGLDSSSAPK